MATGRERAGSVWRFLVGPPLRSRESSKERITPVEGLSALSLDALTSVAYGPEAIIVVLAAAGATALHLTLEITGVIVLLLAILVFSYRQVIDAFPGGGGAYAVSTSVFGPGAGMLAGAALIVDYTLTVAVSIAAGVGSLTSAFPGLNGVTVPICLGILLFITLLNLRGLGESARAFLLPTMVFIVGLFAIIAIGLIHPLGLHEPLAGKSLLPTHALQSVTVLLVLKAFSAGCSALTGVEAIANGTPLFKEPRVVRAKRTEMMLGLILGALLLGLSILDRKFHIGPRSGQTVLSQIMAVSVGRHWAYYVVSLTITLVLALAANTSYGGLPVLASLLSRDDYLPHLFALRGERQVFANGIFALTILSAALLVVVGGDTNSMIPLYAIGVFTGFTLAQSGLAVHWWRERPAGWRRRATINGVGSVITGIATIVFLITKFVEGAWVVVVAIPFFIFGFRQIHAYYRRVGVVLGLHQVPPAPSAKPTTVFVPIAQISRLTELVISEALSLSDHVIAATVVIQDVDESDAAERRGEELQSEWERWNPGVPLRVLHTEFASVVKPLVALIDEIREANDCQLVVLVPVVVPTKWRQSLLHNHLDVLLGSALKGRTDVIVAKVRLGIDVPNRRALIASAAPGSELLPTRHVGIRGRIE